MDNLVILPILCLTEMSPLALKFFVKYCREVKDMVMDPDEFGSELHLVLDRLLLEAWKDVVNGKTFYNVIYSPQPIQFFDQFRSHKTMLYTIGDVQFSDYVCPAALTFMLNDGRFLAINYTQHQEPMPTVYHGQLMWNTPKPVTFDKRYRVPWDSRIRTREWLVELFRKYTERTKMIHPELDNLFRFHLFTDYAKRPDCRREDP